MEFATTDVKLSSRNLLHSLPLYASNDRHRLPTIAKTRRNL